MIQASLNLSDVPSVPSGERITCTLTLRSWSVLGSRAEGPGTPGSALAQLYISPIDIHIMSASQYPSLSLDLTPIFDSSHNATALSICMTIGEPALDTDDVLLTLPLQLANVPSQRYDDIALQASDDSGPLSLHICDSSDSDPQRYWLVRRPTHGDVTIQYRALPRPVDEKTPIGPRVDLRNEHGGLQGSGLTVIPIPPSSASKERLYTLSVQWDLGTAPEGTRAVWTFGEGPEPVKRIGPASLLANCIYAVGPIKSYPAAAGGKRDRNDYTFYWSSRASPNQTSASSGRCRRSSTILGLAPTGSSCATPAPLGGLGVRRLCGATCSNTMPRWQV